jgi:pantoate--beta-alanine ligase
MSRPRIVRTVKALRAAVADWRRRKNLVALVPTMGALHAGHLSLVRLGHRRADRVVASIFVNPAQFAPHEDFDRYPRDFKDDLAKFAAEDVDLVFAPAVEEVYPADFSTRIEPAGPALAGLEDRFRPHFFGGVATVVAKLLIEAWPDFAIFGEKDYQQLQVVTRLARDLDLPVKIVGAPTVREKDGLALSSRNAYLSPEERGRAPTLYRVLRNSAAAIGGGEAVDAVLTRGRRTIANAGFALDYLEARHAVTLAPVASRKDGLIRLLVAAKLSTTRLIDNVGVPLR